MAFRAAAAIPAMMITSKSMSILLCRGATIDELVKHTGLTMSKVQHALRTRRGVQLQLEGLRGPTWSGSAGSGDRFAPDPMDLQKEQMVDFDEDEIALKLAESVDLRR